MAPRSQAVAFIAACGRFARGQPTPADTDTENTPGYGTHSLEAGTSPIAGIDGDACDGQDHTYATNERLRLVPKRTLQCSQAEASVDQRRTFDQRMRFHALSFRPLIFFQMSNLSKCSLFSSQTRNQGRSVCRGLSCLPGLQLEHKDAGVSFMICLSLPMTPGLNIVKAACESSCLPLLLQPAQSLSLLDMAPLPQAFCIPYFLSLLHMSACLRAPDIDAFPRQSRRHQLLI